MGPSRTIGAVMPLALSAPTKAQRCHTVNGHEPHHHGRGFGLDDEQQPEDVRRREPQSPLAQRGSGLGNLNRAPVQTHRSPLSSANNC